MNRRHVIAALGLLAFVVVYAIAPFVLHKGFGLTAFGDATQFVLCLSLVAVALWRATREQSAARLFWSLVAVGYAAWTINQFFWIYYEVYLRTDVPDPFLGDVLLFFHIVPLMAALAVRPHRRSGLQRRIFAADAALILLWWVFLYIYTVIPWQYVMQDLATASFYYNVLYMAENALWIVLVSIAALRATGAWRMTYLAFLVPSVIGVAASQEINLAILQEKYFTGSFYDLPFIFGISLLLWSLWWTAGMKHAEGSPLQEQMHSFASRVAALAMLSLAGFAWFAYYNQRYGAVSRFRLGLTLVAFVALGVTSILRQRFADAERSRLYRESQENYDNLRKMQEQLVRSEKMVAVGELVGGAAHQINNPLTAILGYAELLEFGQRDEQVIEYARKIGQQARRTKELVQNLLRFARQSTSEKKLVDLNLVVSHIIQLRNMENGKSIDHQLDLEERLPMVWGDPAQLMDVCFHLLSNAADALKDTGGGSILVRTRSQQGIVRVEVIDDGPGMLEPRRVFDPFYTTKGVGQGTGLGLSVCYGIIRDHQGEIHAENVEGGGARFVIQLPVASLENAELSTDRSFSKK